jgi:hypothetical protein
MKLHWIRIFAFSISAQNQWGELEFESVEATIQSGYTRGYDVGTYPCK